MEVPNLPPELKEARSDEREVYALVNGLRKLAVARNRYVVGVNPGEITLGVNNTNAIELFTNDGTSLGVIALFFDFTVNP